MSAGEAGERQYVGSVFRQHRGGLGEPVTQLLDNLLELGVHLLWRRLLVDGAHHGGHPGLSASGHPSQQVRHEVRATSLPARTGEHSRYGVPKSTVCIRDHQIHTTQSPRGQRTQERKPERAVLARAHVHTNDLPPALCIHRGRHSHAHVDYPSFLPDLLTQRVQP